VLSVNGQGAARGECRMPLAMGGQALEKAQNGNGQLLEEVGMDLNLAPLPLGCGATSVWGWRRARLGSTGPCQQSTRYEPILQARCAILRPLRNMESVRANSRREPNS
jgi:hypothetical protein